MELIIGDIRTALFLNGSDQFTEVPQDTACLYLMHGRLGTKEKVFDLAREFSSLGLLCVVFDHPNHGTRIQDESMNLSWTKGNNKHAVDMNSQIVQASREVSLLIDYVPIKLGFRASGHAVGGVSQGGHAALTAVTHDSRLSCCVAFIGSGYYEHSIRYKYSKLMKYYEKRKDNPEYSTKPTFESLYPPSFEVVVNASDPYHNVDKILSRPNLSILMLNGAADTLVTNESNVEYMRKIKGTPGGSHRENIKHISFEGVKHEVSTDMKSTAMTWIKERFLQQHNKL